MNKKQKNTYQLNDFVADCKKENQNYDFYAYQNGTDIIKLYEGLNSIVEETNGKTFPIPTNFESLGKGQRSGFKCNIMNESDSNYKIIQSTLNDYGFDVTKRGQNITVKSKQKEKSRHGTIN